MSPTRTSGDPRPVDHKSESSRAKSSQSAQRKRLAITSPLAIIIFVAVTSSGVAADLISKHFAFKTMLADPELSLRIQRQVAMAPDWPARVHLRRLGVHRQICQGMDFTLSTNRGVVFGLDYAPRWMVNTATVGAIVLVIVYFAISLPAVRSLHVGLAMILAGAIGNLYDRLFSVVTLPGGVLEPIRNEVRDFIDCSQIGWVWVFNVADALLVVGVGLILLHMFLDARRSKAKSSQPVKS